MTHSDVTKCKTQLDPTATISESLLSIKERPITNPKFQSKFAHALQTISNPIAHLTDPFLRFEYNAYAVTQHITGKQMEYRHLIRDPHYKKDWDQSCGNELG
mmetsp:Transcript_23989/g.52995  ORF Transcript_23989/g.52995 Transcript_23989/m.52995 type:complete len:102 (-) Transcript_23989:120-425(-)